jgi:hypothetical protein
LLNPQVIPVIVGVFAAGMLTGDIRLRKRLALLGLAQAACICLFLLPWGIRNWVELDAFVPLRSNLGMELYLSNGPDRSVEQPGNEKYDPTVNHEEAQKLVRFGEAEYNRQKMREAIAWIGDNPGAFARLSLLRFAAWWFPRGNPVVVISKAALTLFAFAGLWLMWRSHRSVAVLFAVTWITMPDLYYFIQWSSRMRYPMDWQLLVCASVSLDAVWQRFRWRPESSE